MMSIDALEQAMQYKYRVWFPNIDGKIVSGIIKEINVRTRHTANVMLTDIKYQSNDTKIVACIRQRENDHIYDSYSACETDFYVRTRQQYMDNIKSCHDLYMFIRLHDLNHDEIAASVALEKSYELDLIRKTKD